MLDIGAKWTKCVYFGDFEQKSKKLKFYFVYGVSINFHNGEFVTP